MTYIDYFFRWDSSSDAKADIFSTANRFGSIVYSCLTTQVWDWARDHVIPDVQAWRPSQDTISSGVVVHSYQSGWFAIVAMSHSVSVLENSSRLAFALNRDGPPYVVKNNIGAVLSDIAVSPIFAGSHYPIGGYST